MSIPEPIYTIHDISSETGVPVNRIRKWIQWKLVPHAASKRNDGIAYGPDHLHRIHLVNDWMDSRITIDEMAERIAVLGDRALAIHDPYEGFEWPDGEDE